MTGPKESGEAGNGSPALTGRGVIVASEAGRDVVSAGRKARTAMTQLSATTATMTAAAIFQAPTPAGRGGASVGAAWPADCPAHPLTGVFTLRQAQRMMKKPVATLLVTATTTVSAPI